MNELASITGASSRFDGRRTDVTQAVPPHLVFTSDFMNGTFLMGKVYCIVECTF